MNALFNRAGWLFWGAAALLIVVFVYGSHHYSISGDVGWHYTLVDHCLSNGALPAHLSGHLGPMGSYPPAAHAGVAALSNLTGVAPLQIMFVSALVIPMISYLLVARLALARGRWPRFCFLGVLGCDACSFCIHTPTSRSRNRTYFLFRTEHWRRSVRCNFRTDKQFRSFVAPCFCDGSVRVRDRLAIQPISYSSRCSHPVTSSC